MTTTKTCHCKFIMPEFYRDRVVEWNVSLAPMDLGAHDMIIGRDILQGLGIKFDFTDLTIEWDGAVIPMRDSDSMSCEAFYIHEPEAVEAETDRIRGILDAKYEKADLAEVAAQATHLSKAEQDRLHKFLKKYEDLFDGTLGKWNMGAYEIELKPDATPYHSKAFPIPHIHTATLKLEVERLVEAGVLKQVNQSGCSNFYHS